MKDNNTDSSAFIDFNNLETPSVSSLAASFLSCILDCWPEVLYIKGIGNISKKNIINLNTL